MYHVLIVETAEDMDDSVRLADVGEELVSQSFALAGTLDQSGYIDYLDGGGDHAALGVTDLTEFDEPLVGHGDDAYVRLDGAEGEVRALRLGVTQTIKEG